MVSNVTTLRGRRYDILTERELTFRNSSFLDLTRKLVPGKEVIGFAEYLMSGAVVDYPSLRGSKPISYPAGNGESKQIHPNPVFAEIVQNVLIGKFDPSEVLHDMATLAMLSSHNLRERSNPWEIVERARKRINRGYSVRIAN